MGNKGGYGRMDLLARIEPGRVRESFSLISEAAAMQILKELEEQCMEVEDPTEWIIAAVDEQASPIAKQLQKYNQTFKFVEPIRVADVAVALSKIENQFAEQILKDFEKHAPTLRCPTNWIVGFIGRRIQQQ